MTTLLWLNYNNWIQESYKTLLQHKINCQKKKKKTGITLTKPFNLEKKKMIDLLMILWFTNYKSKRKTQIVNGNSNYLSFYLLNKNI